MAHNISINSDAFQEQIDKHFECVFSPAVPGFRGSLILGEIPAEVQPPVGLV